MRLPIEFEAAILAPLLLRCAEEGVDVHRVVNSWMRRALRQEGTILPTAVESRRPTVIKMRK